MGRRTVILFSLIILCCCLMILRVYSLAQGDGLSEAAARQSSYRLDIAHFRGAIYDCNMEKLVSQEKEKQHFLEEVFRSVEKLAMR